MKYIDSEKLIAEIERQMNECIGRFGVIHKLPEYRCLKNIYSYIDSLQQEQPECGSSEKPNNHKEWSEEDETCLEDALWCVMKTRHFVAKDACDLDACRSAEKWLKSHHPSWKPSKEQMDALNEIINTLAASKHPHENDYLFNILNGLKKNLQKLL